MTKRTFLITGASKGIGYATAEILAERGHFPIGIARTAPESFPGEFIAQDLADREGTQRVLSDVASRYKLDGVVNNVGIVCPAPIEDVTLADLDTVMDLNLRTAIQCTQAALPNMRAQKWGRIVNTSSLTAAGVPFRTCYAAAKTALISFTKSWALELAKDNILVNAVCPGPTDTHLFRTANPPGSESRQRYVNGVPLKRVADPRETGEVIYFFLSDASSFVTGQALYVDGGSSVGQAGA